MKSINNIKLGVSAIRHGKDKSMIYRLWLREKSGALVMIEGYDVAIQYLEEHGDSVVCILKEEIINANDWHRLIK